VTIVASIEATWRIERSKIVAALTRRVRDVGLAEEFAQEALVAALEQWPVEGVPRNPAAWLMTTAKRRAVDTFRRRAVETRVHEQLLSELEIDGEPAAPEVGSSGGDEIEDDLLRLIFIACHPILATEARVALTLRLLGGLSAAEIARAFLVAEATIAQRIVRAKRTLSEARVAFEVPQGADRASRLASVLEVVYLIFNEGYSATSGDDWMRPQLSEEALRLGRILACLLPQDPEVQGLVALMEIQASRAAARVTSTGEPVLLPDQNRARWDRLLLRRGLAALERADALGGAAGPYALQAAIAACHGRAPSAAETDWPRIAALYAVLGQVTPSPVVELNRAVAVAMALGPAAGLAIVDALQSEPRLAGYHLLPSVRGDLLARLGRDDEARAEFERAATLTRNARERAFLMARVLACGHLPRPE
jgi:RNA polymerase sigma factor (sigma-70 family)